MLRTLLLLPAFLLSILLTAQVEQPGFEKEWKEIDSLVNKKDLPKTALKQVQALYTQAKARNLSTQMLKCRLYTFYLADKINDGNPARDIQQLRADIQNVKDPLTLSITHAIIAKRLYAYLDSHRYQVLQRTETNTRPDPNDFSSWSATDFIQAICQEWDHALSYASDLKKININRAAPLLIKGNQPSVQPTLFDLLAWEAIEFYLSGESMDKRFTSPLLLKDTGYFSPPEAFIKIPIGAEDSSFYGRALRLYQSLLQFHIPDPQQDALIALDIKRLQWLKYVSTAASKETLYEQALQRIVRRYGSLAPSAPAWELLVSLHLQKARQYGALQIPARGSRAYRDTANRWEYRAAAAILQEAFERLPKDSLLTGRLLNLQKDIRRSELLLTTQQVVIPDQPFLGSLDFRNIDTVYLRLIKLEPGTILSDKVNEATWQDNYWADWINKSVFKEWIQALPVTNDFQQHTTEIKLPAIPSGEYALLCSGSKDFSLAKKALTLRYFAVSSLSLIRNNADYFVLDRATGMPVVQARVIIQKISEVYNAPRPGNILDTIGTRFTDTNGHFRFATDRTTSLRLTILKGNEKLYLNGSGYSIPDEAMLSASLQSDLEKRTPDRKQVFFFRDRGIYRPGQTVQFKAVIVSLNNKTNTNRLAMDGDNVWVYLRSASGQRVDSLLLHVNPYGSVYGHFVLPEQTMNGGFQLEVPGIPSSNNWFQVESYKSPRFYVQLHQPEHTYKLLDTISIKGIAMAFAGYPISGAAVKYEVTRSKYFLQPYRNFYYPPVPEKVTVAEGKISADQQGGFQIRFPLSVDDLSDSLQYPDFIYQVTADITDINGETHSASTELQAGITNMRLALLTTSPTNTDSALQVSVVTFNRSTKVVPAVVHLQVFPLEKPMPIILKRPWPQPDVYSIPEASFRADFPYAEYRRESDPATWKRGNAVMQEDWQVSASKKWVIEPHQLAPGQYCIEATVNDGAGHILKQEIYTELFDLKGPYKADNQLFLLNKKTAIPGDSILMYSGSVIPGRFVISKTTYGNTKKQELQFHQQGAEVSMSALKILPGVSGWINRSETFVFQNRLYSVDQPLLVSLPDKKLHITYSSYRNKAEPGSEENWTIHVSNDQGPVDSAEIVSTLYDASMDAIAANNWPVIPYSRDNNIPAIFNDNYNFNTGRGLLHVPKEGVFPIFTTYPSQLFSFASEYVHGVYPYSSPRLFMGEYKNDLNEKVVLIKGAGSAKNTTPTMMQKDISLPLSSATQQPEQVRKNFAETAFFLPALYTDTAGNCSIQFTMPESATEWKWLSFTHSKSLATGFQSADITTAKPFLVQPNMPRFLREGDRFELLAKIVNQSDSEVTGQVTLELIDAQTNHSVDGWFQNVFPTQYFTAEAGNSIVIKFPIQVPFSFNKPLRWRIVAHGKQFSDGEENTLAVMSRRILVTDTKPIFLEEDSTVHIQLPGMNDENLTPVALTIQYETKPVWEVIQSLPSIIETPYSGTMHAFNRFYAQTMGGWILRTQPRVAALIQSWKNQHTTPLSPLEKNTSLKSILLQETPWVLDAFSETAQHQRLVELLDSTHIRKDQDSYIQQLNHAQLANGAFSWMPGGRPDNYITLRLLTELGRLKLSGALEKEQVRQLDNVLKKGITYLDTIMAEQYRQQIKSGIKEPSSAYQWEYLFMRSFFPEYPAAKLPVWRYYYQSAIKKAAQQSVYYKAMLALVFARNGEINIVKHDLLPSIRENATQSAQAGMYWKQFTTPSYFNDAIAQQSLLIDCFQELGRVIYDEYLSADITRMKTWLLLQKHQNRWGYAVSAVDACYAVLQGSDGLLTASQDIRLQLGDITIDKSFLSSLDTTGGFEYRIPGEKIQPGMGSVTLQRKSGNSAPGLGAVYWQYFDAMDQVQPAGTVLKLTKQLFIEMLNSKGRILEPVTEQTVLKPGDKLVTRLHLQCAQDMDYVHLKDLRASCLEPETVISGYQWKPGISYYQSASDVSMQFFIDHLNKGSYDIEYSSLVTHIGSFATGIANAECLYAPELTAHSGSGTIRVEE